MLTCQKCGWDSPDYAAFCTNCGHRLTTPAAATDNDEFRFNAQLRSADVAQDDETGSPTATAGKGVVPEAEQTQAEVAEEAVGKAPKTSAARSASSPASQTEDRVAVASGPPSNVPALKSPEVQGGRVPENRTLTDLTTPDFRAMVDLAQKHKSSDGLGELVDALDENGSSEAASADDYNPGEVLVPGQKKTDEHVEHSPSASTPQLVPTLDLAENTNDGTVADDQAVSHDKASHDAVKKTMPAAEVGESVSDATAETSVESALCDLNDERPSQDDVAATDSTDDEPTTSHEAHTPNEPNRVLEPFGDAVDESTHARVGGADASPSPDESFASTSSVGAPLRNLGSLDVNIELLESSDVVPSYADNDIGLGDDHEELSSVDLNPVELNEFDVAEPRSVVEAQRNIESPPPIPVHRGQFMLRCLSTGMHHNRTESLSSEPMTIGRTEGTVQIQQDPYISPAHVRISSVEAGVRIEDMNSMNGTWRRVRHTCSLAVGDAILMGTRIFELRRAADEVAPVRTEVGTLHMGTEFARTG
ncbi:MAG: FHA domain-containing protein, partial [Myxococcota bacterium]|nr:FHA domain-containing protein [Myxococcota bacterium]